MASGWRAACAAATSGRQWNKYLLAGYMVAMTAFASAHDGAQAAGFKTLYSFCKKISCSDGSAPNGALIVDSAGVFYGTTHGYSSDSLGHGSVFALIPIENGRYSFKLLHRFCSAANCADGDGPTGKLIMDGSGNLYGVTTGGGAFGGGTVFQLAVNLGSGKSKVSILYDFCAQEGCQDGKTPNGGLTYIGAETGIPYDGTSTLYGTSTAGGDATDDGVAFMLTYVVGKRHRRETVVHQFCGFDACADGKKPNELIIAAGGDLYGTTEAGGTQNRGVAFEISPAKRGFRLTVLYTFCQQSSCTDGDTPQGPLALDATGNLLGTTSFGGNYSWGTVFRIVPAGTASSETVIHHFCALADCADGKNPTSGVLIDSNGQLFGTTYQGGSPDNGVLFNMRFNGTIWKESVLRTFCLDGGNCAADGGRPAGGLVLDSAGALFGSTSIGGKNSVFGGTIFRRAP